MIRYPQTGGQEIKASYLLFTAPCWAVLSVAAWLAIRRRTARLHVVLVTVAGLYAVSYGSAVAANLVQTYDPRLDVVEPAGFVDLRVTLQASGPPRSGAESDYTVFVRNAGTAGAADTVVRIRRRPARPARRSAIRLTGPRLHRNADPRVPVEPRASRRDLARQDRPAPGPQRRRDRCRLGLDVRPHRASRRSERVALHRRAVRRPLI